MLSGIDDPEIVAAALECGADAYVRQAGCVLDQLAGFLRQTARGTGIFSERPVALERTCAPTFAVPRSSPGRLCAEAI